MVCIWWEGGCGGSFIMSLIWYFVVFNGLKKGGFNFEG